MTTSYEVPLTPSQAQKITINLNGVAYNLTFKYLNVIEGGWVFDFADSSDNPIINGIPLVTGTDLLGQYGYKDVGGAFIVQTDGAPDVPPVFDNLGTEGHLYYVTVP